MEQGQGTPPATERDIGFAERAVAAAGAAVISAVLVNPLDVAKTRLQAQAAGVIYNPVQPIMQHWWNQWLGPSSPECFQYRGTMDVFSKVTRQEGIFRLWRGTGANLALAVPMAFKASNVGGKPPGMWTTLIGVLSSRQNIRSPENVRGYHLLWTGLGAQLARDAPYSAICWTVLEPIRRHVIQLFGDQSNAAVILGANFSAGFIAGVISAGATCPLDVAKTRRQIERDPERVLSMNTRRILLEVWRKEGLEGLFRGAGPRMARAGPSVGIVVSSYEVMKHIMHRKHAVQTYD
ncbi:hypothetical protein SORBI_3006G275100 [Sorghum bicolor]|uniref:Mitochondrial carrier protein n=2 Tax=Sorghum bicolor TaxID=4558 RepID=A0A1B6PP84_SORBI|nr:hypothetical protein SORBI_3006G275100 [Sorghum bicolor]